MAKSNNNNNSKKPAAGAAGKTPAKPVARTETRNSPVPKAAPAPVAKPAASVKPSIPATARPGSAPRAVSHDEIARRAYEIWQSGRGGSDYDNWVRAERELRGGR